MQTVAPWKLFERYGVELEYMICDQKTLNVLPITDKVIYELQGSYSNEVDLGNNIACSNELALHVIEFKTIEPESYLSKDLRKRFEKAIHKISAILEKMGAVLVPSGMHPWMDPTRELQLWNHEYNPIYEAYNRIFHCQGHGWANLQSTHLNISFATDEEFKALHSAIRWLLPLMPGLAASSPYIDGKESGYADTRLFVYKDNQKAIPSIAGHVIPEPVASQKEYVESILRPMWRDIAPFDGEKILQEEWLNSRGAIARFDRMAIEIRVLDIQENPSADFAILNAIVFVLQKLAQKVLSQALPYNAIQTEELKKLFFLVAQHGAEAEILHPEYLKLFGVAQKEKPLKAKDIWKMVLGEDFLSKEPIIRTIVEKGTLSERMRVPHTSLPLEKALPLVVAQLAHTLRYNVPFYQFESQQAHYNERDTMACHM